MGVKNTDRRYGSVAQALHWLMAGAVVGLFGLGLWMTSLDYYDPWYKAGPFLHEGAGVLVFAALVFRLYWRAVNPVPSLDGLTPFERRAARSAHWGMYGLMAVAAVSGYLISTGGGRPVAVFDLFSLPALVEGKRLADQAGAVHYYASLVLIALAALHAAVALKHHFMDRDGVLQRMLPGGATETESESESERNRP